MYIEDDGAVHVCVHSLEGNDVGVFELAQMFDLSLLDVPHFLHSHVFTMKLAQKDRPLCPTAHPLQLGDLLERHLPGFWKRHSIISIRNDSLLSPIVVLTFLALLVLCRVGFPDHCPHWLQASEQAFQKAPSARLQPEAVGLVAHGATLGSALLQLQHTVGEVGRLVAQGGAVAVGVSAAAASDGVDGEHVSEDALGWGEFGVWGARRHLRIRPAEGGIGERGAEP